MLNGLLQPSSGHIYYNGEDIHGEGFDKKKLRSKVGLVFQYPEHQLFEETVLSDVMFGPRNLGLSEEECRKRATEALRHVGMEERYFEQSPFDLSGGQKRRAAIAGVLAMRPEILVLDEPTAGLDPRGRDEILGLITDMKKQLHMTILLVSHSMGNLQTQRGAGGDGTFRPPDHLYYGISADQRPAGERRYADGRGSRR